MNLTFRSGRRATFELGVTLSCLCTFVPRTNASNPTFTQQAYLKASNSEAGDFFGKSVAVSGDTVVVGSDDSSSATGINGNGSNNSASRSGAAYVFVRSGTLLSPTWIQQA